MWKKLESFLFTGGNVKWYISKFLQKVKHRVTIRPRNFIPRHIPKKIENPSASLFTNVHISIIYNSQRVKGKKRPTCPTTDECEIFAQWNIQS